MLLSGNINLRKLKIADSIPDVEVPIFAANEGPSKISSAKLLKGKKVVIFSNPGVFVASYMASQIPTFESHYEKLKSLGIDDVFCLVNNDYFVVANYAEKYQIKKVKFICDNDLQLTNAIGYISDLKELSLGYRCWPVLIYAVDGVAHKIFYEDFAVTPIDCYSATSCLTIEKFLDEKSAK